MCQSTRQPYRKLPGSSQERRPGSHLDGRRAERHPAVTVIKSYQHMIDAIRLTWWAQLGSNQ
jgi:hypothetical protein